jgi:hypothetical protein
MRTCPAVLVVTLLALAAPARADVLVVDAAGGGDFAQIAEAVLAAADGDTLVVKAGIYGPFVIDGKALDVVADTGAFVWVQGGIVVRNTQADQAVLLQGLRSTGQQAPLVREGLVVEATAGPLRVQLCHLQGEDGLDHQLPWHGADGVRLDGVADVVFKQSVLVGGAGGLSFSSFGTNSGGDGLRGADGVIAVHGSSMLGGDGGEGDLKFDEQGGPGGHGARLEGGTLFAGGSDLAGGLGGGDGFLSCQPGGDGLRLIGPGCHGVLLDTGLQGGTGACSAPDGLPLMLQAGATSASYAGDARPFQASSPVREGQEATMTLAGVSGDVAFLFASLGTTSQPLAKWAGVLHAAPPFAIEPLVVGVVPASGKLTLQVPVPPLPVGTESIHVHLQSLHVPTSGAATLGYPHGVLLLDAAF